MTQFSRRTLFLATGAAAAAGAAGAVTTSAVLHRLSDRKPAPLSDRLLGPKGTPDWKEVRALFPIAPDWIDMSAMLITSHPAPVTEAIERHRHALDANPVVYLEQNNRKLLTAACDAAGRYLGGIGAEDVALTDSTTMGVALVYNGLRLKPGDEVLTTDQGYYVTHESLRLAAARHGAGVRRIPLYEVDELGGISAEALAQRIVREVRRETRALALTWVHSSTGVKLPVAEIAAGLGRINAGRDAEDAVLLCIDGVHGFGNQNVSFAELGCDFFMAGCHKWLFGPRGTAIVAGTKRGWRRVMPTIPSFFDLDAYGRWIRNDPAAVDATTAAAFMPGGFKSFEHYWSMSDAFALHALLGKAQVAQRTAELATQLKEGLAQLANVRLCTPHSPDLSAGIVAFDVDGHSPGEVAAFLQSRKIVASVAPYAAPHVRLTPSMRNTPEDIETVLSQLREVAA